MENQKPTTKNISQVEKTFSEFYNNWMSQLEQHLTQVLNMVTNGDQYHHNEAELQLLVNNLTTHFKEYYTVKWEAAHKDVMAFYNPIWLSPYESAHLWMTGWKPLTVFKVIDSLTKTVLDDVPAGLALMGLSEQQLKKIEELRVKIKFEENKVENEMERQQVALADRKIVLLSKLEGSLRKDDVKAEMDGLVNMASNGILSGLERVMKAADCVRLKTLKGVLEILTPLQCVQFLGAVVMVQIQLSQLGKVCNNSFLT